MKKKTAYTIQQDVVKQMLLVQTAQAQFDV